MFNNTLKLQLCLYLFYDMCKINVNTCQTYIGRILAEFWNPGEEISGTAFHTVSVSQSRVTDRQDTKQSYTCRDRPAFGMFSTVRRAIGSYL
jgi:hypothetical protein